MQAKSFAFLTEYHVCKYYIRGSNEPKGNVPTSYNVVPSFLSDPIIQSIVLNLKSCRLSSSGQGGVMIGATNSLHSLPLGRDDQGYAAL